MSRIIDKRLNGKNNSAVNRQRFIRRYKKQIKQTVSDSISKRSITEVEKGESIKLPTKDLSEPIINHGQGGIIEIIHPGNKTFVTGDKIKRPKQEEEKGQGSEASNEGEGEDNFVFEISRDEFLDMYFEDLELPDLVRKQITQIPSMRSKRPVMITDGHTN